MGGSTYLFNGPGTEPKDTRLVLGPSFCRLFATFSQADLRRDYLKADRQSHRVRYSMVLLFLASSWAALVAYWDVTDLEL